MNPLLEKALQTRKSDHPILDTILGRWSPRALTGETITEQELMTLFEAARWAPSSYNNQPWRFVYARRDTPHWDKFFLLMGEFNQSWTKNAAVLVVVVSKNVFEHNGKPTRTHSFDTGAAWVSLAIQASSMGLVAHGMEGFDYDKAKEVLHIPDGYSVEAMLAIGKLGNVDILPEELQKMESPSGRRELSEIVMEGEFK